MRFLIEYWLYLSMCMERWAGELGSEAGSRIGDERMASLFAGAALTLSRAILRHVVQEASRNA